MDLKMVAKKSDVFSLGRIINFIMTGSHSHFSHIFSAISEKATHENPEHRYDNAQYLLNHFDKALKYHKDGNKKDEIKNKIDQGIFDEDVEFFYSGLSENKLCHILLSSNFKTRKTLIEFMKKKDSYAEVIIQNINKEYKNICKRFEDCDPFSDFMYEILTDTFSYRVKEIAAITLN